MNPPPTRAPARYIPNIAAILAAAGHTVTWPPTEPDPRTPTSIDAPARDIPNIAATLAAAGYRLTWLPRGVRDGEHTRLAVTLPTGASCGLCGHPEYGHFPAGLYILGRSHEFTPPTRKQILNRLAARYGLLPRPDPAHNPTENPPAPLMPAGFHEYAALRRNARPDDCATCQTRTPVGHWPSLRCNSANGPGKPILPHCTCDACF